MPNSRADDLKNFTRMLLSVIEKDGHKLPKANSWISIGISLGVLLINLATSFGVIHTKLENHIDNTAIHITEQQKQELILNTVHRIEYTHGELDKNYTRRIEHEALKERVQKLEKQREKEK